MLAAPSESNSQGKFWYVGTLRCPAHLKISASAKGTRVSEMPTTSGSESVLSFTKCVGDWQRAPVTIATQRLFEPSSLAALHPRGFHRLAKNFGFL
jgi:hypothetical protein